MFFSEGGKARAGCALWRITVLNGRLSEAFTISCYMVMSFYGVLGGNP